jgi:hypothetical protein
VVTAHQNLVANFASPHVLLTIIQKRSALALPCFSFVQRVQKIPSIVQRLHAFACCFFVCCRHLVWVIRLSLCIIRARNLPESSLDWIHNTQQVTCVLQPELTHRQRSVQQQKNDKSQSFILFLGFIRCMSNKLPKPPPTLSERQAAQAPLARAENKFGELKYFFGA